MQAIDKYRPFKSTGDDFADSNPIFSFYFYRYFYEIASDICLSLEDPVEREEVNTEIKQIENNMAKMQAKSQINFSQ